MLTEGASNLQKIVEAKVSLTALHAADVGRVQACALSEFLLRPPFCKSQLSDPFPESASVWRCHAISLRRGQTMSPETISIAVSKISRSACHTNTCKRPILDQITAKIG